MPERWEINCEFSMWWFFVLYSATSARDRVPIVQTTMSQTKRNPRNLYRWRKMWKCVLCSHCTLRLRFFPVCFRNSTITKQIHFPMECSNATGFVSSKRGKTGEIAAMLYSCWNWAEQSVVLLSIRSVSLAQWFVENIFLARKTVPIKPFVDFTLQTIFHLTDEAK